MSRARLLSRLTATTSVLVGGASAGAVESQALFVTSPAGPDAPLAMLGEPPSLAAPSAPLKATIVSALADSAAGQVFGDTVFEQMGLDEEALEPPPAAEPVVAPAGDDGLYPIGESAAKDEEVLFEADYVFREDQSSPIIAEGNVRAYFGERYLRADRLSYDIEADIVIAEGNVSITDRDLETAFAGRVELTGDLRDGIAENFSALLAENTRLAADTAVQEQGARTRLTKAVFTACNVCNSKGEGKTPTWRVRALRVTRDRERRVVWFHHAFFEIKGVPLFYMPFIQAPDPAVERQSGFLTPVIGASSRLGFNFELPYYLAISNHQDATFYPKYTSNDGVLWQGEYRRVDNSGAHTFQAGVIDFNNQDPNSPADVPGVRWHVFAHGVRRFGENWETGYDVERVSDDTYLRNYSVRRRGELRQQLDTSRSNRLRTNTFVRWTSDNTTVTADAYLFQGLRATDRSELTPYVLPLVSIHHDVGHDIAGGRARIDANFVSLQRTAGIDSQRFSASVYWEREHITPGGHKFNAFAELRSDAYYYHDLDEGTEILPGLADEDNEFEARFAPSAGIEWSYPLTRRAGAARFFIGPQVQLVASPTDRNPASIINEDSQSTEFDFAGLFEYNKSTGFDAFEDGQRMNAGVAMSAIFDNGIVIEGSVGEQFRLQKSDAFFTSTGLGEKRSDIVGSVDIKYKNYVGIENRFRIDDENGSIQRAESLAFLRFWRFTGSVSYVRLNEENALAALVRREEVTGNVRVNLTRRWAAGFGLRKDLFTGRTITQDFSLGYSDECSSIDIIYRNDRTRDVGLGIDNALLIRFTLRSLVE